MPAFAVDWTHPPFRNHTGVGSGNPAFTICIECTLSRPAKAKRTYGDSTAGQRALAFA